MLYLKMFFGVKKVKRIFKKSVVLISLVLAMVVLFSSCADKEGTAVAVQNKSVPLIIEFDGKIITVEDTEGQSIEEILKDVKIQLTDTDIISVDTSKKLSEGIVIRILSKATVIIKNTIDNTENKIVLVGSSVKDALDAAGVKLADNQITNYKLTDPLEDGMEIVISIKEEPTTQAYVPEDDSDDSDDSDYRPDYNSNSNSNSGSGSSSSVTRAPETTKAPAPTKAPETTKAPAPTKAPETTSGRTIVNVDIYEDCDGSGHGVKVITYSDGTQEEVPF